MRWKEINEAPLSDFGVSGDLDQEGGFRSGDLKAVQNPKWIEKAHNIFSKTPFDFNIYIHNPRDGIETIDGKVMAVRDLDEIQKYHGLTSMTALSKIIGFTPPKSEQSINVLLLQNEGDERVGLTPWIMAHRVAHAILYANRSPEQHQNKELTEFINDFDLMFNQFFRDIRIPMEFFLKDVPREVYNASDTDYAKYMMKHYAKMLGQFKSARDGSIRNSGEFKVECFTQYLVTGKITFNRPEIPNSPREPKEEPNSLLDKARAFYSKDQWTLADDFAKKVVRAVSRPYDGYLAIDSKSGNAMASFGGGNVDPARVKELIAKYEAQGYTIKPQVSTPAQQKRYADYQKKFAAVTDQYSEWRREGLLRGPKTSNTDRLDEILDKTEESLNACCHKILVRCLGKALVL
jgi:hypothetical protein